MAIHQMVMKRMGESASASGILYPGSVPYCVDTARNIPLDKELRKALARVAAYYIWCLTTNRPFVDGSKRTAFQTAEVFLRANGFSLGGADPDGVVTVLGDVAAGRIHVEGLLRWVEKNLSPFESSR
jgi:death-on-curing protein